MNIYATGSTFCSLPLYSIKKEAVMEHFSNLTYLRPDGKALLAEIDKAAAALAQCENYAGARKIFLDLNRQQEHFTTMGELAYIRNSINTLDAFYEKEMEYFHNVKPNIQVEMKKFHEAFLKGRFLKDFENEFGSYYIQNVRSRIRLADQCNVELQIRESALTQEYSKIVASSQTDFHGETLNFYGLLKKMQCTERQVRKEAMEAWAALYESISGKLDEIYSKLIDIRLKMAENLGFSGYEEMVFLQNKRYTYTPDDVALFREQILRYVVPLCRTLFEKQKERLGIETLYYYDESLIYPEGNAVPKGSKDEMLAQAGKMYRELSEETGIFFDCMLQYGLFDLETKPGKQQGGYCTILPEYKAPFIFSNFNGTDADVEVLTHEAGHAFQAFEASRKIPLSEQVFSSEEVDEIPSMTMELFTYPWMGLFFGDQAEKYRKAHLWSELQFIPYIACVDEFQHRVYLERLTDSTGRRKVWRELEKKYLPWRNYDGNTFLEQGGFWMQKLHIFVCPFYYIDYALARIGSLEYYERMADDFQATWKDYHRLCCAGGTKSYPELLALGNLSSPFKEGTVKKVMEAVAKFL